MQLKFDSTEVDIFKKYINEYVWCFTCISNFIDAHNRKNVIDTDYPPIAETRFLLDVRKDNTSDKNITVISLSIIKYLNPSIKVELSIVAGGEHDEAITLFTERYLKHGKEFLTLIGEQNEPPKPRIN